MDLRGTCLAADPEGSVCRHKYGHTLQHMTYEGGLFTKWCLGHALEERGAPVQGPSCSAGNNTE